MGQSLQRSQLELEAIKILNIALALLDTAESFHAGALVADALERLRDANGIEPGFPLVTGGRERGGAGLVDRC